MDLGTRHPSLFPVLCFSVHSILFSSFLVFSPFSGRHLNMLWDFFFLGGNIYVPWASFLKTRGSFLSPAGHVDPEYSFPTFGTVSDLRDQRYTIFASRF